MRSYSTIENLPPELLSKVLQSLDHEDHLTLRLVSHIISEHAAQWAFRRVVLELKPDNYPDCQLVDPDEAAEATNNILDRPDLRRCVQHFCFDTGRDDFCPYFSVEAEMETLVISKSLELALSRIGHFENLRSVSLRFCGKCYFKHECSGSSGSLKLLIIMETTEIGPNKTILLPENHEFFQQLPSVWLKPPMAHLTTLFLMSDEGKIGYCPRLELRDTHFPALHTLALGNYAFTHDWQFAWITQHAPTLKILLMDTCLIVHRIITPSAKDHEGYLLDPVNNNDRHRTRLSVVGYDTWWSHFFHTLASDFQLEEFHFGASEKWRNECAAFETIHALESALYPNMYMAFVDFGKVPRYMGWDEKAAGIHTGRPDYMNDKAAFEELQSMLQGRRAKSP
ncbi:hypothetical protein BD779DRAFT_1668001 [Infundibulicybe gibba]|nr:hypothetical protein BD779DRAFT_1668001 [Infundibulicybe gibba]